MECILDGLTFLKPSISITKAISLLFVTLSTSLLFILQLTQQPLEFAYLFQISFSTISELLVFIMQLRDFSSQAFVLCGQICYFGIELVDLPLQIQVFLFSLEVFLHIDFFEPSVRTVDSGLTQMEGIGGDAFGSGRDALLFLLCLAGHLSGGDGWLLPLQFSDCLQKLPIEPTHILIGVAFGEVFDIPSYFFEGDAYFLGDIYYQLLPHLQQLSILAYRLFLKVLAPLLQCLFEDEKGVGESGMGFQEEVEHCVHASEVFLVFVGWWLRRVFEVVHFLREGERRGVFPAGVQQHMSDVRKYYYYCTINNPSHNIPSHPIHGSFTLSDEFPVLKGFLGLEVEDRIHSDHTGQAQHCQYDVFGVHRGGQVG